MGRKKKDNHHDVANVVMATCAIIVAVIEIARFIMDYVIQK
jgi:hypothetical protein